jgi:hypothetical protein
MLVKLLLSTTGVAFSVTTTVFGSAMSRWHLFTGSPNLATILCFVAIGLALTGALIPPYGKKASPLAIGALLVIVSLAVFGPALFSRAQQF